jgi:hypothetical protein
VQGEKQVTQQLVDSLHVLYLALIDDPDPEVKAKIADGALPKLIQNTILALCRNSINDKFLRLVQLEEAYKRAKGTSNDYGPGYFSYSNGEVSIIADGICSEMISLIEEIKGDVRHVQQGQVGRSL